MPRLLLPLLLLFAARPSPAASVQLSTKATNTTAPPETNATVLTSATPTRLTTSTPFVTGGTTESSTVWVNMAPNDEKVCSTPGGLLRYPAGLFRRWKLSTVTGWRFRIKPTISCSGCRVNFFSGTTEANNLAQHSCHDSVCSELYLNSESATIEFISKNEPDSDRRFYDGGLQLAIFAVPGCRCGQAATELPDVNTRAEVLSPGFPNAYPPSCDCEWRVSGPVSSAASLHVQFVAFDLQYVLTSVKQDFVSVSNYEDGKAAPTPLETCTGNHCNDVDTATTAVLIRLHSTKRTMSTGFRAIVSVNNASDVNRGLATPVYVALVLFIIGMIIVLFVAAVFKRRSLRLAREARERRRASRATRAAEARATFTAESATVAFNESPPPGYDEALAMAKPVFAASTNAEISSERAGAKLEESAGEEERRETQETLPTSSSQPPPSLPV